MLLSLVALGILCISIPADIPQPASGAAEIWYLGHCGYAVRTANHLLIFDYIELEEHPTKRSLADGFIDPAEFRDLDVHVFVTHSHIDHYDRVIHTWERTVSHITYHFGWPGESIGNSLYYPAPRTQRTVGELVIHTVNSRHAGVDEVAYLVQVDGLTLFHEGDYQGVMSEDGPSHAREDMQYLRGFAPRADIVFLGAWTGDCIFEMIRGLEPKVIFPMHYRKREFKYREFARDIAARGVTTPILLPGKRGDRFSYRDGRIMP